MERSSMTSMERVLAALSHREPDRVPLFLLFGHRGAREMGMSIREYVARSEVMIEAQLRLRRKFDIDCLFAFAYAAVETEAMGGEVLFFDDAPPTAGTPVFASARDVAASALPDPADAPPLRRFLDVIEGLKRASGDDAPIIGVVMGPFSLPVMQLGFGRYLDLLYGVRRGSPGAREEMESLMAWNTAFCIRWARAQMRAGAHAMCYFDPLSSPTMTDRDLFEAYGKKAAGDVAAALEAPMAFHVASGRSGDLLPDVASLGYAVASASALEDLAALKERAAGKIALLGNLDGICMRRWSVEEAERQVRVAIEAAAAGGGFVLADHHGEIPWQVDDEVLHAISRAVRKWGAYPLGRKA